MEMCLRKKGPVPQWYLAMKEDQIIGGMGVIENDFHNRKDLAPNVCAVFVEEDKRCNGIAGALLQFVCADMKERGIQWIFIGGVDNVLLKMADVTLLGMAIKQGVQIASKSVVKANPHEKVGVFCKMNGRPKVIEYAELPEKMAEEIDNNGELKYGESHIMCNLYTIEAIEKVSKEHLMYHSAFKKNSYLDEKGREIVPEKENSYKFESFIFDAFEFFDDIAILRGKREEDFAPVKNKEGVDSPKTAKELYEKFWNKQ